MPQSIHIHKSMLLRGLQMPQAVLETADLDATATKAKSSGRSFGGVPFRGDRNSGRRGGRINYSNDRFNPDNPIAKHMDPNFAPPPQFSSRGPPQYPPLQQGYGHQQSHSNSGHQGNRPAPPGTSYYNQHQNGGYGPPNGPPQSYPYQQPNAQAEYVPPGGYHGQYADGHYQHR